MYKFIFTVASLAAVMHLAPAFAKASNPAMTTQTHPISGLIGDWREFRAGILDKTKQYDKYSDISNKQLATLPATLAGHWQTQSSPAKPGNRLHTELILRPNKTFTYRFVALADSTRQQWQFSGSWEVKNRLLMLLIDHSTYPGEQKHDILVWRLLHVGQHKLVYVRSGADQMMAMTRRNGRIGS